MGRPIRSQFFLGANAPHQIQATVWGANDTGSTPGYLSKQNSPRRFNATTVNGTSLTTFVNGSGSLAQGDSFVKVFPVGTQPSTYATANLTLKALGPANVVAGGSGYQVGDFVHLVGGVYTNPANVQVASINVANGNSAVTFTAPVAGVQNYSTLPANVAAIATANATGNGSGAVVSFNFGIATANIITGGAGYTDAVLVVVSGSPDEGDAIVAPTFTQPTVSGGAVTTGPVTVLTPGIVNFTPIAVVEEQTGATEYVRTLTSMNYLNTFSGNQYRWLYKGQPIPSDYASLGVKLAYLDTL